MNWCIIFCLRRPRKVVALKAPKDTPLTIASGLWSGNYFMFAVWTVSLLGLKHLLNNSIYWLVQVVLFIGKSMCLSLWKKCVFCWIYNPILLIKQRNDISLEFLLGHRRKNINCSPPPLTWNCVGSVDYKLLRYTSVHRPVNFLRKITITDWTLMFMPGYQETAIVKIELDLYTSATKIP